MISSLFVECSFFGVYVIIVLLSFGDYKYDSFRKWENVVDSEKFENIVKGSRIRVVVFDNGVEYFKFIFEDIGVYNIFVCMYLVFVIMESVDFIVVSSLL